MQEPLLPVSKPLALRVLDIKFALTECRTRLPFRFGIVTMESALSCVASALIETEAGVFRGHSSDLLVPKWFDKDPKKSLAQDARELVMSAQCAAAEFLHVETPDSLFSHWWRAYARRVQGQDPEARDRLVRGFGVALCERALMDAACRAGKVNFHDALRLDLFGFRPGDVLGELKDWSLSATLEERPKNSVIVRHTVGLGDALVGEDLLSDPKDGLPVTLEQDIRRYGYTHFKIKLKGERAWDLNRLERIATVLEQVGVADPRVTIDGNEQFASLKQVDALFGEAARIPAIERLLSGLLYIEQPLARQHSFDLERTRGMKDLSRWAPTVIDEADTGIDSFPRALDLGYGGVSVKNCKGVFRALLCRGLCDVRGGGAFQCSEDLTNLPLLALQQDLALLASLGLEHSERNGHHYFRGLDLLPVAEREQALDVHSDLYRSDASGPDLAIAGGRLQFGSIHAPGFGHSTKVDFGARRPCQDWLAQA